MTPENSPDGQTLIGGRYALGELLGRGGMAEVRKGTDARLGRVVAVKRLRTDLASDVTFQARFRREAQSSASLNHPAIVAVYDTGEEQATDGSGVSQPYIVMEYVAGRTLRDILREGRKILPERALEITSGVLSALDYSHRAGIIHRDIKPGNVMLTPSGDVKVMDFGIARAMSDASSTMTQTAAVVGTAQYLSPEQARGEPVDSRSDVYSAGCLLYELLTGRPPFVGDSPVAVAYQHVREPAAPPSDHDTEVTPEVDAIVMKALAKRVEDRYQSAAAMRSDIERSLAGHPVRVVLPPPIDPPARRHGPDHRRQPGAPARRGGRGGRPRHPAGAADLPGVAPARGARPRGVPAAEDVRQPERHGPGARPLRDDRAERAHHARRRRPRGRQHRPCLRQQRQGQPGDQPGPRGRRVGRLGDSGRLHASRFGLHPTRVPSLIGQSQQQAATALEDAHLDAVFKSVDSDQPKGTVVSTSPPANTQVPQGSPVTVSVSKGPQKVPDVVGLQQKRRRERPAGPGLRPGPGPLGVRQASG